MSTPLVSVLLPTYNSAATLGPALDSLAEQTERDHEVVVVDDGSRRTARRKCSGHAPAPVSGWWASTTPVCSRPSTGAWPSAGGPGWRAWTPTTCAGPTAWSGSWRSPRRTRGWGSSAPRWRCSRTGRWRRASAATRSGRTPSSATRRSAAKSSSRAPSPIHRRCCGARGAARPRRLRGARLGRGLRPVAALPRRRPAVRQGGGAAAALARAPRPGDAHRQPLLGGELPARQGPLPRPRSPCGTGTGSSSGGRDGPAGGSPST